MTISDKRERESSSHRAQVRSFEKPYDWNLREKCKVRCVDLYFRECFGF
jgi:hypothetical protein